MYNFKQISMLKFTTQNSNFYFEYYIDCKNFHLVMKHMNLLFVILLHRFFTGCLQPMPTF